MKWVLIILGVVVVLIATVFLVGSFLPVEHSATVTRSIDANPDRIWEAITSVEDFSDWRSGVSDVEVLPDKDDLPVWRETTSEGPMTLETIVLEPGRTLSARIADEGLQFGGTWTYRLEPAGEGTTLSITEDGEVYSALYRFVSKFIMGHERTINTYFDDLENRLN